MSARARGFTLMELIATMTMLSAIGTAAAFILFTALDGYTAASVQADLYRRASSALDRITRELREIPLDAGGGVAADIDEVAVDRIEWSGGSEIALLGSTLWLNTTGENHLMLEDVAGVTLTAFDADRTAVGLPTSGGGCDAIRRIGVEITLSRNGESASLRSMVFLRCTMAGSTAP